MRLTSIFILCSYFAFSQHAPFISLNDNIVDEKQENYIYTPPADVLVFLGRSNNAGNTQNENNANYTGTGEQIPPETFIPDHGRIYDVFENEDWRPVNGNDPLNAYPTGASVNEDPDNLGTGGDFCGQETTISDRYFLETGRDLYIVKLFSQTSQIGPGGWTPTDGVRRSWLDGSGDTAPIGQPSIYSVLNNALPKIPQGIRSITYRLIHESTSGVDSSEYYTAIESIYNETMNVWFPEVTNKKFVITINSDLAVNAQCCPGGVQNRLDAQVAQMAFSSSGLNNLFPVQMDSDPFLYKTDELHYSGGGYFFHDKVLIEYIKL